MKFCVHEKLLFKQINFSKSLLSKLKSFRNLNKGNYCLIYNYLSKPRNNCLDSVVSTDCVQ